MSLSDLLLRARPLLAEQFRNQPLLQAEGHPAFTLFFSLCDGETRARVCHVSGSDFTQVWLKGAALSQREAQRHKLNPCWLRIDWVTAVETITWSALDTRLSKSKRNYFRQGLALDKGLEYAFLEQELNANAMLYPGANVAHAQLNPKNFSVYTKRRYGESYVPDFSPDVEVYLLSTEGLFVSTQAGDGALPGGREPQCLPGPGLDAGRRSVPQLNPDQVYSLVDSSAQFLARQVNKAGRFIYGHFPCFGRKVASYNALRHASTVHSMLEAWELTRQESLLSASERALVYLAKTLIRSYPQPDGTILAYNVDVGDEIKLGANAVSLLALVKYTELTGDQQYLPLMEQLALGMARMQDAETGCFVHVLHAADLSLKQTFRIIYYDGEAAFGLMRLYGLTKDPRWLAIVEKAFDYFLQADHWKAHDHWLSYCANELTRYKPDEKYFRFGVQNISGHLNFILRRESTYPTLLELSMAFEQMLVRIQQQPELSNVLEGLDIDRFYRALNYRAHYLLNGFFWPEIAMYFSQPSTVAGSFFIRHHSFRVRIDDVHHYLSGFVAYWKYLTRAKSAVRSEESTSASLVDDTSVPESMANFDLVDNVNEGPLTAAHLSRVTDGKWVIAPETGWQASGICVVPRFFQEGHLLFARQGSALGGLSPESLKVLALKGASGLLCENAEPLMEIGLPVLQVPNVRDAVMAIGRHARARFPGRVLGVTGSAGKTTTVAMAAHVLRTYGKVGETFGSANLPIGVAWNMAGMPQEAFCWVLELAIGQMPVNTAMAKPDVAVVTNVGPAHLEYHGTTENIALKKARIFDGMSDGGVAVICRDILHFEIFSTAAERRALKVLTYGVHDEADVRFISMRDGHVQAQFQEGLFEFSLGVHGEHMALNALAVISSMIALGLPWKYALRGFATFEPVVGRGAQECIAAFGRQVTVLDEAYNANPLSMVAALDAMRATNASSSQRVLILGDMLELGVEARHYHEALKAHIIRTQPDRVLLCGELMRSLWLALIPEIEARTFKGGWFPDAETLKVNLPAWLEDGDVVLFKGSNSTGLHRIVSELKAKC